MQARCLEGSFERHPQWYACCPAQRHVESRVYTLVGQWIIEVYRMANLAIARDRHALVVQAADIRVFIYNWIVSPAPI